MVVVSEAKVGVAAAVVKIFFLAVLSICSVATVQDVTIRRKANDRRVVVGPTIVTLWQVE